VLDFFADEDTRQAASRWERMDGGIKTGFTVQWLLPAIDRFAEDPILGVVCGTGFEDRPELLAAIVQRWPLLGNSAPTVASAKDPLALGSLCREAGIPHPDTSLQRPEDGARWIARRIGGSGGGHIASLDDRSLYGRDRYYQRHVDGRPVSALFVANGVGCRLIGFSEQWSAPTPRERYRYGGAVRPVALPVRLATDLSEAVAKLVARLPLVGVNSVDFLVREEGFHLLEINPRPSATWDLFEANASCDGSLMGLHLAACEGRLERLWPQRAARASAIVYADRDIEPMLALAWPDWTADRQSAGSSVARGEPLCTVLADAETPAEARDLAEARSVSILAQATGRAP
jgi:predicted ATP-grasp superfamily ATP-dependent carboligase